VFLSIIRATFKHQSISHIDDPGRDCHARCWLLLADALGVVFMRIGDYGEKFIAESARRNANLARYCHPA
jgi:hypothetical protein